MRLVDPRPLCQAVQRHQAGGAAADERPTVGRVRHGCDGPQHAAVILGRIPEGQPPQAQPAVESAGREALPVGCDGPVKHHPRQTLARPDAQ